MSFIPTMIRGMCCAKMLNNYAAKSGMPSDETLIIASIVEREARSSEEMAKVASVFLQPVGTGMEARSRSHPGICKRLYYG